MQTQKFLRTFPPFEVLLMSLLAPCRTVRWQGQGVAAGCGAHRPVIDIDEARNLPNRSSVTLQLIGMNDLWNSVVTQEASQEGCCGLGITVPLEHAVDHGAVLIYRSPEPGANTISVGTDLIPVAQFFSEEGSELDAPLAEGLVADLLSRAGGAIPARRGHGGGSGDTAKPRVE